MAPFRSPAKVVSSMVANVAPIRARPLNVDASAAATVTVHVLTSVAGQTTPLDLPFVVAKSGRRWYWVLDGQALKDYAGGSCPEESG